MDIERRNFWNEHNSKMSKNRLVSLSAISFEKDLPRASIIIDLGGGDGSDALHFMKRGHSVILVDLSQVAMDEARRKVNACYLTDKLTTIQMDYNKQQLPLENNSVDAVYASQSLHFFEEADTTEIIRDISRVLRPDGIALILAKSPEDQIEMDFLRQTATEIRSGIFLDIGTVRSRYTVDQWREILSNAGVADYEISKELVDLSLRNDRTNSGNLQQLLTKIRFKKA